MTLRKMTTVGPLRVMSAPLGSVCVINSSENVNRDNLSQNCSSVPAKSSFPFPERCLKPIPRYQWEVVSWTG